MDRNSSVLLKVNSLGHSCGPKQFQDFGLVFLGAPIATPIGVTAVMEHTTRVGRWAHASSSVGPAPFWVASAGVSTGW